MAAPLLRKLGCEKFKEVSLPSSASKLPVVFLLIRHLCEAMAAPFDAVNSAAEVMSKKAAIAVGYQLNGKHGSQMVQKSENEVGNCSAPSEPPHKKICLQESDICPVSRKRHKFALLLSYSGKGYLGMQYNPGLPTIEGVLLNAMKTIGITNEPPRTALKDVDFQRSSRTDKGVSAARQIVSFKMAENIPDVLARLNDHLPEHIRAVKLTRVTKGFNAKHWCDSRTYSYMCPTFAFAPLDEISSMDYRITPEVLKHVNDLLQLYKGTHNFHNFTSGVKSDEATGNRYMKELSCSDPFVRGGIEWVYIKITGQSFLLHQIRKMVALVIVVCKGVISQEYINLAWGKERVDVPIAPSLGLVLEDLHFNIYNNRYGADGIHEILQWDDLSDQIQAFREKFIDANITETELQEKTMLQWLPTIFLHNFTTDSKHSNSVTETKVSGIPAASQLLKKTREKFLANAGSCVSGEEVENVDQKTEEQLDGECGGQNFESTCKVSEHTSLSSPNTASIDSDKDQMKFSKADEVTGESCAQEKGN